MASHNKEEIHSTGGRNMPRPLPRTLETGRVEQYTKAAYGSLKNIIWGGHSSIFFVQKTRLQNVFNARSVLEVSVGPLKRWNRMIGTHYGPHLGEDFRKMLVELSQNMY